MPRNHMIRLRRGTAAEWTSVNPVLGDSEPGYVTDEQRLKVGDGVTAWVDLPYTPTAPRVTPDSTDPSILILEF